MAPSLHDWQESVTGYFWEYVVTSTGSNGFTRQATGNAITGDYALAESGVDAYSLAEVGTANSDLTGTDTYDSGETGNQASGAFVRSVTSSMHVTDNLSNLTFDTSYSLDAAGNFLVGSLSLAEAGDNRYALLEGFNNIAANQNGGAASNLDFKPYGPAFQFGEAPEVPTGGGSSPTGGTVAFDKLGTLAGVAVGSIRSDIDTQNHAVSLVDWRAGGDLSGATTLQSYAEYGAEQFKKYCFAAGTPLLTPTGEKNIEDFRVGDQILSAPDWNPLAPVQVQVVEELFSDVARVINVHVAGRLIRTTAEHAFFAWGRGWTKAADLREGDRLRSHDGTEALVESVTDAGEVTPVYNVRVAFCHTYFVGDRNWIASLWSHNYYEEGSADLAVADLTGEGVALDSDVAEEVAERGEAADVKGEDLAARIRVAVEAMRQAGYSDEEINAEVSNNLEDYVAEVNEGDPDVGHDAPTDPGAENRHPGNQVPDGQFQAVSGKKVRDAAAMDKLAKDIHATSGSHHSTTVTTILGTDGNDDEVLIVALNGTKEVTDDMKDAMEAQGIKVHSEGVKETEGGTQYIEGTWTKPDGSQVPVMVVLDNGENDKCPHAEDNVEKLAGELGVRLEAYGSNNQTCVHCAIDGNSQGAVIGSLKEYGKQDIDKAVEREVKGNLQHKTKVEKTEIRGAARQRIVSDLQNVIDEQTAIQNAAEQADPGSTDGLRRPSQK